MSTLQDWRKSLLRIDGKRQEESQRIRTKRQRWQQIFRKSDRLVRPKLKELARAYWGRSLFPSRVVTIWSQERFSVLEKVSNRRPVGWRIFNSRSTEHFEVILLEVGGTLRFRLLHDIETEDVSDSSLVDALFEMAKKGAIRGKQYYR